MNVVTHNGRRAGDTTGGGPGPEGSGPRMLREFGVKGSYQGWEYDGSIVVIRPQAGLSTDVDGTKRAAFVRAVEDQLRDRSAVIIDASSLSAQALTRDVASLFMRAQIYQAAQEAGKSVSICNVAPGVRPYLEAILERGLIHEAPSVADALAKAAAR